MSFNPLNSPRRLLRSLSIALLFFVGIMTALLIEGRHALQAASDGGSSTPVRCENGFAGPYPCQNVDLVSHLTISELGGSEAPQATTFGDGSINRPETTTS